MTSVNDLVAQGKLELWFRKEPPVSFDAMVLSQCPDAFWIEPLNAPAWEYGDEAKSIYCEAFYAFRHRRFRRDNKLLQLGHGDLVVSAGSGKMGVLLVNEYTTQLPLRWLTRAFRLMETMTLLHLGTLRL